MGAIAARLHRPTECMTGAAMAAYTERMLQTAGQVLLVG